jgi:hypothetical protein
VKGGKAGPLEGFWSEIAPFHTLKTVFYYLLAAQIQLRIQDKHKYNRWAL